MITQIIEKVNNKLYLLKISIIFTLFNKYIFQALFLVKSIYTNSYIYSHVVHKLNTISPRRKHRRGNPDVKLSVSMGRTVLQFFEDYENKA